MDKQSEKWKAIKGFEGRYIVSDDGRVMSLAKRSGSHGKIVEGKREKMLTPCDNGKGYLYVTLRGESGKRKHFYVHRLVAETFIDNPCGCKYINHLDFDTKNNQVDNLQWCTQKENVCYSSEKMKHPKKSCKPTNTGEKYIRLIRLQSGVERYRLCIRALGIDRKFKTLEDAKTARDEVMQ